MPLNINTISSPYLVTIEISKISKDIVMTGAVMTGAVVALKCIGTEHHVR